LRLIQAKPLSVAPVIFSFESLTTPDFSYRLFRSTAYTALPEDGFCTVARRGFTFAGRWNKTKAATRHQSKEIWKALKR
jgi:hypothetical protein